MAIEFRSLSKTAGFTGTRCAYTVIPKQLTARNDQGERVALHGLWNRRHTTKFNGASYPIQKAAHAVFLPEGKAAIEANIAYYMENARIIREGLSAAGYSVYGGVNAPYIWVRVPAGLNSLGVLRQAAAPGARGGHARLGLRQLRRGVLPAVGVRLPGERGRGGRADPDTAVMKGRGGMTENTLTVPAQRPTTALRDRIIERLSTGFADGAIDTDEFERRVTVVHRSESAAEIEALVDDLPPSKTPPAPVTRALVPAAQARPHARTVSVFGSVTRRGNWTVPRKLEVRAIFGNVELDFREALLPAGGGRAARAPHRSGTSRSPCPRTWPSRPTAARSSATSTTSAGRPARRRPTRRCCG